VSDLPRLSDLESAQPFSTRHIGPDDAAVTTMLATLGFDSLEALMDAAVPAGIRTAGALDLPAAAGEDEAARALRAAAAPSSPSSAPASTTTTCRPWWTPSSRAGSF
jgi:glycine dehydrogenase